MRAAREEDARPAFIRALLEAEVFVALFNETPGEPLTKPGSNVIAEGTKLVVRSVVREDRHYFPFFTAPSRIWAMTDESHAAAPESTRAIFERNPGANFILNPGSNYGKEFFPEEVASLLAGQFDGQANGQRVETATQALVGTPADYPHDFVRDLKKAFTATPDVEEAFLSWTSFGGKPPNLLLEVVSSTPASTLMPKVGPLIEAARPRERLLDVAVRTTSKEAIAKGVVQAFYSKSGKGLLGRLLGG